MLGKLSIVICLLVISNCSWTNVTDFWAGKIGSNLTFEAYTGSQQIDWYYPYGKSSMHYQLFSAHAQTLAKNTTAPLIIWLQGGPGSSSMFGAFTQIGPILIKQGNLSINDWAWNTHGHLLFIDSPLNVGFSFAQGDRRGQTQVNSTQQATDHLVNFLFNFYKQWPQLKDNKLYITGQSFAGHYIPSLAKKIAYNNTQLKINLQGVAIGDGWVDPLNQVNYYDSYLWSVGVIGNKFRDTCNWFQTQSIINIYEGKYQIATNFFDYLTSNSTTPQTYMGNISMYNFRNYNGVDRSFAQFLSDNKQFLGVDASLEYISSNHRIYTAFGSDISKSYASDVAIVIGRMKTLIYNGQNDVVVNTPGVLQYLNSLTWYGARNWKRSKKQIWKVGGQVQGWAKVSDHLWFVQVNGAGHMVPTDKPLSSFIMLGHFLHDQHDWDE